MAEMDNSIMSHMMNMQTQMLEEIKQLRQEATMEEANKQIERIDSGSVMDSPSVPVSTSTTSFEGTEVPTASTVSTSFQGTDMAPIGSPVNPVSYGAIASGVTTRTENVSREFEANANRNFFSSAVSDFRDFDPMRMSDQDLEDYFVGQTRAWQSRVLGGVDNIGSGVGLAASFAVPGLLPGALAGVAVGGLTAGAVGMVQEGATESLAYQDILRNEGYKAFNAFEATNEFGGIGLDEEQLQDLSKYIRELAPEKYLDSPEMQEILQGSLDQKLLRSATDTEDFKKKFSDIVDTVKEITISMDQSIDEALKFMGEMKSRGITDRDMTMVSGQFKVASSVLGVDTQQGAQMIMGATDQITQGTSLDYQQVASSTGASLYISSLIQDDAEQSDPQLYDYIKNNGGAGQMGARTEQQIRSFTSSDQGKDYLLGFFGSAFEKEGEDFVFNQQKFDELVEGDYSFQELNAMSNQFQQSLSETDKAKLVGTADTVFQRSASASDNAQLITRIQQIMEEESGTQMDPETALTSMGIASNYEDAAFMTEYLDRAQDEDYVQNFESRSMKETLDAAARAYEPGLGQRMKYWTQRKFGFLEDGGQFLTDTTADVNAMYREFITGIGDRDTVGGSMLNEFSSEELDSMFTGEGGAVSELQDYFRGLQEERVADTSMGGFDPSFTSKEEQASHYLSPQQMEINEDVFDFDDTSVQFTEDMRDSWVSRLDEGTLAASDIKRLQDRYDSGELSGSAKRRAEYVLNKASGEYDGFWGNIKQFGRNSYQEILDGEIADQIREAYGSWDATKRTFASAFGGEDELSQEGLEGIKSDLNDRGEKLNKNLTKAMTSADLNMDETEYDQLENYIRQGDVSSVRQMTSNEDLINSAEDYQKFLEDQEKYSGAIKNFTLLSRQTEGYGRLGTQIADYAAASGAFSKDEAEQLFGDYRENAEDLLKDLEDGDLSVEEMFYENQKISETGEASFENISQLQLKEFAQSIAENNSNIDVSDMIAEGSESFIDPSKLYNILANEVIRSGQADQPDAEQDAKNSMNSILGIEGGSVSGDEEDYAQKADDHKKAMNEMINAFSEETDAMREYLNRRGGTTDYSYPGS